MMLILAIAGLMIALDIAAILIALAAMRSADARPGPLRTNAVIYGAICVAAAAGLMMLANWTGSYVLSVLSLGASVMPLLIVFAPAFARADRA